MSRIREVEDFEHETKGAIVRFSCDDEEDIPRNERRFFRRIFDALVGEDNESSWVDIMEEILEELPPDQYVCHWLDGTPGVTAERMLRLLREEDVAAKEFVYGFRMVVKKSIFEQFSKKGRANG